ncbi:MAG: 2-C-methyl-D-erythritol 4-phosphate cytidylyltransferase [Gammaproteobacteria bacterium]|nr:2-C-methyl-D-erythritol 4-phosphate cytidylyltransferase [Gammaproteobacteria bacterium]
MRNPSALSRVWAVIPAAGKGSRMGGDTPKQYLPLLGRTVIEHTVERLANHPRVAGVVLVLAADDAWWRTIAPNLPVQTTLGGVERCHSVLNGLYALTAAHANDWILVHDAARPCLRATDIDRLLDELQDSPCGGLLALPVRDTLKRCTDNGAIEATVDRARLWHALTPQMFRLGALQAALEHALTMGLLVTDEAQAIEFAGGIPRVVEGSGDNLKITRPEDLKLAELFLLAQR